MHRYRFFAACLLTFSLGCAGKPATEQPITIGHLASGATAKSAILLAVEEANAAEGKVAGRPVAILHPDIDKDEAKAEQVAIRLITIDRVVALLAGTGPATTEKLSRTAQQYNLPLVATVSPVSGTLPPNGFSLGLSPAMRGKTLARFGVDHLKKPGVTIVVNNREPVNAALAAAFAETYRQAGGKVNLQEDYGTDEELTKLLAKLEKSKSGAVLFVGPVRDFARLQQTKREPGSLLFAGQQPGPNEEAPAPGTATSPIYQVTAFTIDPSLPRTKDFAEKYQGRFQRRPDAAAALAYDSARVLFDAMRRAEGFQGPKVRDELLNTKDFESVTGPLSFDKAHNARRPAFVVRVEKDGEKLEKRYDPE